MLDSIAHSNGTRASVVKQPLCGEDPEWPVGAVAFDAAGDIKQTPITILRVEPSKAPPSSGGFEDAVVQTMIRPLTSLVR